MMPTQVFLTPDGREFFRNEGTLEREQIAQISVEWAWRLREEPGLPVWDLR